MYRAITRMMNEIASVMDGRVYGAWLYGSVALGDFRLGWSDIDFVALTQDPLSESQAEKLLTLRQDMLKSEPDNLYYRSFEGVIASLSEYRSQSFQRLVYWGTSDQKITGRYTPDVFSLFELAKDGKPICGNNAWILPAPDRKELIGAIHSHFAAIRKYAVETNESLYSCGWLLDIARCVYTLRHHDVIAKTQAGIWALKERLFVQRGGHQLQLNTVNREKMLDAQQHPENYRNLIVRVWGWSGYFVELDKCYQDHIIRRVELQV